MKAILSVFVMLVLLTSCGGARHTGVKSGDDGLCLDCYFLGTYPLTAYFTTSLSKRDTSLYLAHSRDTDQVRVRHVLNLLDQCQRLDQSDPARIHTYCTISRHGQEIGRVGIPPMRLVTPSSIKLYWNGYFCDCQWEVFPLLVQGFEPAYRDTILDYIQGGTLNRGVPR